jgi:hypothetical protein
MSTKPRLDLLLRLEDHGLVSMEKQYINNRKKNSKLINKISLLSVTTEVTLLKCESLVYLVS